MNKADEAKVAKVLADICASCKECPHMRRLPLYKQVRELKGLIIKLDELPYETCLGLYNKLCEVEQTLYLVRK